MGCCCNKPKNVEAAGNGREYLHKIKAIYGKPIANIKLNSVKLEDQK